MAVDITLDLLKAAVIKLAELTGENRFILIGRDTLAITASAPFQEFARSDDKLEANRQKDKDFLRAAFEAGLIDLLELKNFIHLHAPNDFVREKLAGNLNNLLGLHSKFNTPNLRVSAPPRESLQKIFLAALPLQLNKHIRLFLHRVLCQIPHLTFG